MFVILVTVHLSLYNTEEISLDDKLPHQFQKTNYYRE